MAYKDMRGFSSRNENKTKDTAPDHKGSITINGINYWMSGWDNENEKGEYISWSLQVKEDKKEHSESKANAYQPKQPTYINQEDVKTSSPTQDDSDSIPF